MSPGGPVMSVEYLYDCPGVGCDVAMAIVTFDGRAPALVPCARCLRAERMTAATVTRVNARCLTCGGHFRCGDHARCDDNAARTLRGAA